MAVRTAAGSRPHILLLHVGVARGSPPGKPGERQPTRRPPQERTSKQHGA